MQVQTSWPHPALMGLWVVWLGQVPSEVPGHDRCRRFRNQQRIQLPNAQPNLPNDVTGGRHQRPGAAQLALRQPGWQAGEDGREPPSSAGEECAPRITRAASPSASPKGQWVDAANWYMLTVLLLSDLVRSDRVEEQQRKGEVQQQTAKRGWRREEALYLITANRACPACEKH